MSILLNIARCFCT